MDCGACNPKSIRRGDATILVPSAHRFARDLIVQATGWKMLRERGIELIAADSPNAFLDDTPTANFIRQVLGAVAQLDKAMTVAKLRGARQRKKAGRGQVRGAQERDRDEPGGFGAGALAPRGAPDADAAGDRGQARSSRSPLLDGQAYAPSVVARMVRGPALPPCSDGVEKQKIGRH
jgi:hypothetical protein